MGAGVKLNPVRNKRERRPGLDRKRKTFSLNLTTRFHTQIFQDKGNFFFMSNGDVDISCKNYDIASLECIIDADGIHMEHDLSNLGTVNRNCKYHVCSIVRQIRCAYQNYCICQ